MAMKELELPALLRELDDPERLELPPHYDRAATGLALSGLVRRLKGDFGAPCESWLPSQHGPEVDDLRRPRDRRARIPLPNLRAAVVVRRNKSLLGHLGRHWFERMAMTGEPVGEVVMLF
ncbi:hypothetical protein [Streptomyces sp. NPDC096033]|uniref:hypothetical protein n=1 Tax=Streptomyces sp. NPDC096033 TaxID=3366071 RepID=UPI00381787EB